MKEYKYTINGNQYQVAIEEAGETTAKAIVNGTEYIVEWEKPKEEKPVVKVKPAAAPKPATAAPAAAPAAAPLPAATRDHVCCCRDNPLYRPDAR